MCDPTVNDRYFVQKYKDSLPLSLMTLMKNMDELKTLDEIHALFNFLTLNSIVIIVI